MKWWRAGVENTDEQKHQHTTAAITKRFPRQSKHKAFFRYGTVVRQLHRCCQPRGATRNGHGFFEVKQLGQPSTLPLGGRKNAHSDQNWTEQTPASSDKTDTHDNRESQNQRHRSTYCVLARTGELGAAVPAGRLAEISHMQWWDVRFCFASILQTIPTVSAFPVLLLWATYYAFSSHKRGNAPTPKPDALYVKKWPSPAEQHGPSCWQ